MDYSTLVILLVIGTVALYIWFFRSKRSDYEEQSQIPFQDDSDKFEEKHK